MQTPSETTYILYYRQGQNPHPQFFIFNHPASENMRAVVDRVKRHCELMNYRFVNVRPFLVDLAEAERRVGQTAELGVSA